jgi:hypothetical protein
VLAEAGYTTRLIRKFHLAQSENDPAGIAAPALCWFTDFNRTLLGAPIVCDFNSDSTLNAEDLAILLGDHGSCAGE